MEWLDNHDIPFWDLCFMKHKGQVGADIYIEDSPEHVDGPTCPCRKPDPLTNEAESDDAATR